MNQLNERIHSTTYTSLNHVFDSVLKAYDNRKQEYSYHSKSIHVTQATNGQHHHRGSYYRDDEK